MANRQALAMALCAGVVVTGAIGSRPAAAADVVGQAGSVRHVAQQHPTSQLKCALSTFPVIIVMP